MADPASTSFLYQHVDTIIIGVALTIIGKAVWSYFSSGRVEKIPIYVTTTKCQQIRESCNLVGLKDKISDNHAEFEAFKAEIVAQIKSMNKNIDRSNDAICIIQKDTTEIKAAQARSIALLETIIEKKD